MNLFFAVIFFLLAPYYEQVGYINDFTHTLDARDEALYEKELSSLEKNEGIDFVVVVLDDLQNRTIQEVAQEFFTRWQIGHMQRDSGILLIITPDDSFIDLGYGLDGIISTQQAKIICEQKINPLLAKKKLKNAINAGIKGVFATIGVTFSEGELESSRSIYTTRSALIFLLSIPLLYMVARFAPTRWFFLSPLAGFALGLTQSFGLAIVLCALGLVMVLISYILKHKIPPRLKG